MTDVMDAVTMKGKPVTLTGKPVKTGRQAPDAVLTANDLKEFRLSSLKGKKVILSVVPSLDTGTCDLQTRRFNAEAVKLGDDVKVVTVSMDLPFAQKRWCGATRSEAIITLSDHRKAEFGEAYGLLIKDLRLLTRAVFVIDADGIIRHKELVKEITTEPDYAAALAALAKL
jgi:thiol peroxidase